ncbi:MAG TPA: amidohydrolase family protein [Stellaceae bacterium]|nr:amidohydrolase family protein [Stellaceae bacterium]
MSETAPARRIDVHFHIIPPFYRDAAYAAGAGPALGRFPEFSPELALDLMDRSGIELALTSVSQPGVQFAMPSAARELARRCNDYAAELAARRPERFGAFALVPMHEIDDALAEIAYAYDMLGFAGVCLFASYGAKFLGDPRFEPVLAALDARAAVVFVHPAYHPSSKAIELAWPGFMMEFLFDTTRAAVNLLFSGALERFPRIRFILAHAGGLVPYFAWRLSVSPMVDPRLPQWPREKVLEGLRHFWYDTALSPGAQTMGALKTVAAPERILFGSDWPYANSRVLSVAISEHEAPVLHTPAERAAIDRGNALALFPRYA